AAAAVFAGRRRRRQRLVRSGPQRRLCADGDVPAAPRARAARAGPFRRPRRFYQCGDEAPGEGGALAVAQACRAFATTTNRPDSRLARVVPKVLLLPLGKPLNPPAT